MTIDDTMRELGVRPVFGRYAPLAANELTEIGQRVEGLLPSDFMSFVSKYGCAYFPSTTVEVQPLDTAFPEVSHDGAYEIAVFFGGGGNSYSVLTELDVLAGRMPTGMLPVAGDHSSNYFLLSLTDGVVWFWSALHEEDEDDYISQGQAVPPDLKRRNLRIVATSFVEFLFALRRVDAAM